MIIRQPWDTNSISLEPLFFDAENGDLRLKSGSPCIDAGADVSSVVVRDFEGKNRGRTFDIGALEYSDDINQDGGGHVKKSDGDSSNSGSCFIGSTF